MDTRTSPDYSAGGRDGLEDSEAVYPSSFFRRLGCLDDEFESFQGKKCTLAVSKKHTITGFQSGGYKTTTRIRVNNSQTLSLEPEVIGRVLKMGFVGVPVPRMLGTPDHERLLKMVKPAKLQGAWSKEGLQVSTFQRGFREYVKRRERNLFILKSARLGFISASKAFCMMEEYLNQVRYNWAEERARHIEKGIVRAVAGGANKVLSVSVTALLESFISRALALLGGLDEDEEDLGCREPTGRGTPDSCVEETCSDEEREKCRFHEESLEVLDVKEEHVHCQLGSSIKNSAGPNLSRKSFLRRLGCLTRQGNVLPFRGKRCAIVVSKDYTITGFQDGADKDNSSIQVNGGQPLSLNPEMVGEILGISLEGLDVPSRGPVQETLEEVVPPGRQDGAWCGKKGFTCKSFRSDFRKYVVQRQGDLGLYSGNGTISAAKAYCLKEEFLRNTKFNWAKERVEYVHQAMRVGVSAKKQMSSNAKALLATYISAALPLLKGLGKRVNGDTVQPRRSSRNMPKNRISKDDDVTREPKRRKVSFRDVRFDSLKGRGGRGRRGDGDGDGEETDEGLATAEEEEEEEEEKEEEEEEEEVGEEPDEDHTTILEEEDEEEEEEEEGELVEDFRKHKRSKPKVGSVLHDQSQLESVELRIAREETKAVAVRAMGMAERSMEMASRLADHQAQALQFYGHRADSFRRKKLVLEEERREFEQEKREFALKVERLRWNRSTSRSHD